MVDGDGIDYNWKMNYGDSLYDLDLVEECLEEVKCFVIDRQTKETYNETYKIRRELELFLGPQQSVSSSESRSKSESKPESESKHDSKSESVSESKSESQSHPESESLSESTPDSLSKSGTLSDSEPESNVTSDSNSKPFIVVVDIQPTDPSEINLSELTEIISESFGIIKDSFNVKTKTNDKGQVVQVVIEARDEKIAEKIMNEVNSIIDEQPDKCKLDILCRATNVRIESRQTSFLSIEEGQRIFYSFKEVVYLLLVVLFF